MSHCVFLCLPQHLYMYRFASSFRTLCLRLTRCVTNIASDLVCCTYNELVYNTGLLAGTQHEISLFGWSFAQRVRLQMCSSTLLRHVWFSFGKGCRTGSAFIPYNRQLDTLLTNTKQVPAAFGVTENSLVIYTSNMFAIISLRSL